MLFFSWQDVVVICSSRWCYWVLYFFLVMSCLDDINRWWHIHYLYICVNQVMA